jgi:pimeloyl-ACP methyl ester carboxylesterase
MAELIEGRAAVVLPGGNYGVDGPLLMYSRIAANRRGARDVSVSWDLNGNLSWDGVRARVLERSAVAIDATNAPTPLVIGKSLGTFAAPLVAERALPAVWLTPLLDDERVVAALRRSSAPCLLVGGRADPCWDGALARALSPHVYEVEGADHGLFLPERLAASVAVLGGVITAVEDSMDGIVWS